MELSALEELLLKTALLMAPCHPAVRPARGSMEMTPEAYSAGETWKSHLSDRRLAARRPPVCSYLRAARSWGEIHLALWARPLSSQPPDGECGQCGSLARLLPNHHPALPAT